MVKVWYVENGRIQWFTKCESRLAGIRVARSMVRQTLTLPRIKRCA